MTSNDLSRVQDVFFLFFEIARRGLAVLYFLFHTTLSMFLTTVVQNDAFAYNSVPSAF